MNTAKSIKIQKQRFKRPAKLAARPHPARVSLTNNFSNTTCIETGSSNPKEIVSSKRNTPSPVTKEQQLNKKKILSSSSSSTIMKRDTATTSSSRNTSLLNNNLNFSLEDGLLDDSTDNVDDSDISLNTSRTSTVDTEIINRKFDEIKDICQSNFRKINENIKENENSINEIQDQMKQMMALMTQLKPQKKDLEIPKSLSRKLRNLYQNLPEEEKWELDEVITSPNNVAITNQFVDDVFEYYSNKNTNFDLELIEVAATRYFRNLRQEQIAKADIEKYDKTTNGKRLRTRRQRTFEMRSKHVMPHEKDFWENVDQEMMSDEEDIPEGLKVKSLKSVRVPRLNDLIKRLDERKQSSDRKKGVIPVRKRRIVSESPIKRKIKKKSALIIEAQAPEDHVGVANNDNISDED